MRISAYKFEVLWQVDYLYGKHVVQSRFWVTFGTSILNNLYNRLKYVFEHIISIPAIENIHFAVKINKKMKFYLIWEDLVHFRTASLNWRQYQEAVCKILKEIHVFLIC